MTPRRMLQESDELLYWVEECLVQEVRIVPGWLISRLMVVLRHAQSGPAGTPWPGATTWPGHGDHLRRTGGVDGAVDPKSRTG